MLYIYQNPEKLDAYIVGILENNTFKAGGGKSIKQAYKNAITDTRPFPVLHICETHEDFLSLKQTHPELFL